MRTAQVHGGGLAYLHRGRAQAQHAGQQLAAVRATQRRCCCQQCVAGATTNHSRHCKAALVVSALCGGPPAYSCCTAGWRHTGLSLRLQLLLCKCLRAFVCPPRNEQQHESPLSALHETNSNTRQPWNKEAFMATATSSEDALIGRRQPPFVYIILHFAASCRMFIAAHSLGCTKRL